MTVFSVLAVFPVFTLSVEEEDDGVLHRGGGQCQHFWLLHQDPIQVEGEIYSLISRPTGFARDCSSNSVMKILLVNHFCQTNLGKLT